MVDTGKEKTESDKLWDEIKDLRIDMFALPNQSVKDHAKRIGDNIPNVLYLKLKSTAVIASLEAILNPSRYIIEPADGYIIVRRTHSPPTLAELAPTKKKGIINRLG